MPHEARGELTLVGCIEFGGTWLLSARQIAAVAAAAAAAAGFTPKAAAAAAAAARAPSPSRPSSLDFSLDLFERHEFFAS